MGKRRTSFKTRGGSVNPKFRAKHYTFKKNGKEEFPIGNAASARSALRLIGKAPPKERAAIRRKAGKFLKSADHQEISNYHYGKMQNHETLRRNHSQYAHEDLEQGKYGSAERNFKKAVHHGKLSDFHNKEGDYHSDVAVKKNIKESE